MDTHYNDENVLSLYNTNPHTRKDRLYIETGPCSRKTPWLLLTHLSIEQDNGSSVYDNLTLNVLNYFQQAQTYIYIFYLR